MTQFEFGLINSFAMALFGLVLILQVLPVVMWIERKGMSVIQDRWGPIRANIGGIRLFGMLHTIADVIKLLVKEDITPPNAQRFYYLLAPMWAVAISLLPIMLIPLAAPVDVAGFHIRFQTADYTSGLLMLFAITGLGVYGIILAGWASNSKYALLGGLRSSAQMISYELAMGLAIVAVLMVYQDLRIENIVQKQGQLLTVGGMTLPIPNWGIFMQPVAFMIFLTAAFAETNRTPFDLAEGESELVAGYHTEYSSMGFAMFFMAEYINMIVVSFVVPTLFLGGYQVPYLSTETLRAHPQWSLAIMLGLLALTGLVGGIMVIRRAPIMKRIFRRGIAAGEYYVIAAALFGIVPLALLGIPVALSLSFGTDAAQIITAVFQLSILVAKASVFWWLYIHVRFTLPRFRYDQLMNLGWKLMIPLALLNIFVTGVVKMAPFHF